MNNTTRVWPRLVLLAAACLLITGSSAVLAADPLANCQSGVPYLWPGGGAGIPFNPDQGDLGPLTNAQAVTLTQQAFDRWGNISTSSASFLNAGLLPMDVDITNFGPYLEAPAPDGLSAIVFDETGEIFDLLFGPGSGILGFAGPEWGNTITCEILEGYSFLNGPAFTDLIEAEDVMVHEFGHYNNLAHVELNGQLIPFSEGGDTSGPSPDNTFGTPAFIGTEVIETMYPFYFTTTPSGGAGTRTPHADDIAGLSTLYPAPNFFATTGSISGTIFAPNGTTRLSGVNVIARNVNDPFIDAVSAISGGFTDGTSQSDPVVGTYTLNGLTPGGEYAVFVDEITALAGRFSTPAVQPLPGPEEFWNDANESSDPDVDDPLEYVAVTATAGSPAAGTDIIFNSLGPGVIPLGDDDFAEIFLPFPFEICGQSFGSVFVNSNGSLTFGAGDADYSESVGEFLAESPRVAGLWDDLNPSSGGVVSYSVDVNLFRVRFEDVPEYFATGANTFQITLHRSSNHIDIDYGNLTASDGLAGVSCGGAVTSGFEAGSDLSAFAPSRINLHNQPAAYELFSGSGDLANSTVRFNGTTDYEDSWAEPNDQPGQARQIQLPFDSVPITRFTEIEPTGGDVDFYRFTASGGLTLVAEIIGGQLDTMMAVFDVDGNLLAFDDDGGSGLLSKVRTEIPADGQYFLVVTTFPDYGLTGAGNSGGRYVLDIYTRAGQVLSLGDDDSEEVSLGFTFPYQGQNWNSVFVNSNGNLTFGSGDTDWWESVSEFLAGSPRIAPLWDDLSPNNGGEVVVTRGAGSFTVSFIGVPEFFTTGSNTFSVTLSSDGSVVIEYGAVSASDGLVGVTEGGSAADPGESDLSTSATWPVVGTTYELFTFGDPFDLGSTTVTFQP